MPVPNNEKSEFFDKEDSVYDRRERVGEQQPRFFTFGFIRYDHDMIQWRWPFLTREERARREAERLSRRYNNAVNELLLENLMRSLGRFVIYRGNGVRVSLSREYDNKVEKQSCIVEEPCINSDSMKLISDGISSLYYMGSVANIGRLYNSIVKEHKFECIRELARRAYIVSARNNDVLVDDNFDWMVEDDYKKIIYEDYDKVRKMRIKIEKVNENRIRREIVNYKICSYEYVCWL